MSDESYIPLEPIPGSRPVGHAYGVKQGTFPRLETLATSFLQHNDLPQPTSQVFVSAGLMLYEENQYHVLISSNVNQQAGSRRRVIGGPSDGIVAGDVTYSLEGTIRGEQVELRARVSATKRDRRKTADARKWRQDDAPYWFVLDSKFVSEE